MDRSDRDHATDSIKALSLGVVGYTGIDNQHTGLRSSAIFPVLHQSKPSSVMRPNCPLLPRSPLPPLTTYNNCLHQSQWLCSEIPGPTFPLKHLKVCSKQKCSIISENGKPMSLAINRK